jgi:hypothetical protein
MAATTTPYTIVVGVDFSETGDLALTQLKPSRSVSGRATQKSTRLTSSC